jgi:hypothetical protein
MYNIRKWLNGRGSASTGSVVAYHGKPSWRGNAGKNKKESFLEISDCRFRVRLHRTDTETLKQFIKKLKKLRAIIDQFIIHLEGDKS